MKVYIVIGTSGGFAREDEPVAVVYGAFTDEKIAKNVKLVTQGKIEVVELDEVKPGYIQTMKALGLEK